MKCRIEYYLISGENINATQTFDTLVEGLKAFIDVCTDVPFHPTNCTMWVRLYAGSSTAHSRGLYDESEDDGVPLLDERDMHQRGETI